MPNNRHERPRHAYTRSELSRRYRRTGFYTLCAIGVVACNRYELVPDYLTAECQNRQVPVAECREQGN